MGLRTYNMIGQRITADGIRDVFDNWKDRFPGRKNAPWGFNNYERWLKFDDEALEGAARFLSEKASGRNGEASIARYDLMQNPGEFQRDASALKTLTQLDLVSFPSINVVKKGSAFGLADSSSGETHLLCQFIGIMADVRSGSLILIDEPENSSHPDWQMNYVGWLREIFKDCMEHGCYSWTVDEILQDVMEMKSSRTAEFKSAMTEFEKALDDDSKGRAKEAYKKLLGLIKPGNELLELLRIQMIGLSD